MTDSPEQDKADRSQESDPDLAGYLQKESPRRPAEPDALATLPTPPGEPMPPPGADMRDMEKSLVERIADVDDDRRRSAMQLRKALETHRDEISAQRGRDHNAILVLAGIEIILLAGMLLLFSQLFELRGNIDTRLTALETAVSGPPRPAAGPEAPPDIDARLAQLERQVQPWAGGEAPGEQLHELADAIEAIGDRLTAVEGLTREAALSRARETPRGEPAATGAPVEARVAALVDERLASLEARIDELRIGPAAAADGGVAAAGEDAGDRDRTSMSMAQTMTVLQLAGLPSRDAVNRFIARHALPERVYLKVDSVRGRTWYGLIHSLHPDMAAAEAARDALPADLARLDTWLRELPPGTRLELLSTRD
jgi:DamX protein